MYPLFLLFWLACGAQPGLSPLPGAPAMDPSLSAQLTEASAQLPPEARRTAHLDSNGNPLYTNRMALERSPYLQQHAHHPVDWRPWGPEALQAAEDSQRLIFLSIGYSTCHWCHVMARESFDSLPIAELLNRHFIPIKVDREERPDVDATYMEALLAMRGRGGWPANLILTPTGEPLFAMTYLPPEDGERGVEKGLKSVLITLTEAWEEDREALLADAARLTAHLTERAAPSPAGDLPSPEVFSQTTAQLLDIYDAEHGGFGPAPRFPRPTWLTFLLRQHHRTAAPAPLSAVDQTLHAMANSALYDQLGGGFHRYTTDTAWRVPHFEKMLYDQAQLAQIYLEAYQATKDPEHARIARETLEFVIREMSLPEGGFRSALDAESVGPDGRQEGRFYTWTPQEAAQIVEDERVLAAFGLHQPPQIDGRHALYRAEGADLSPEALAQGRRQLFGARAERPRPASDDKVVTAWHAMTISALVQGYQVLGEPLWLERAQRGGTFALRHLRQRNGRVHRSWRGELGPPAVLEDLALLVTALLDLFEATSDPRWIEAAVATQRQQDALFSAENGAWYRTPEDGDAVLIRQIPLMDGSEPTGIAASLDNLHRLRTLFGDDPWDDRLNRGLHGVSQALSEGPQSASLLTSWARSLSPPREILIIGEDGPERDALISVARERWLPHRLLLTLTATQAQRWSEDLPLLRDKHTLPSPTAFVCERGLCEAPTSDPEVLAAQLQAAP